MKLNLAQEINLRQKVDRLLGVMIELIVRFSDYSLMRHITLAEAGLFAFASLRAIWFMVFGVANANYDYVFGDNLWTAYFTAASAIHLTGFFVKSLRVRIVATYLYAFVWTFLLILAIIARTNAPAPPALVVLSALSLFVIVRLSDEKSKLEKLSQENKNA